MTTITLDKVKHKGKEVLLLKFPYNFELQTIARRLPDARWSNTHKAWHTPYSVETLHEVKKLFAEVANIDAGILKEKLAKAKIAPPDRNYPVFSLFCLFYYNQFSLGHSSSKTT